MDIDDSDSNSTISDVKSSTCSKDSNEDDVHQSESNLNSSKTSGSLGLPFSDEYDHDNDYNHENIIKWQIHMITNDFKISQEIETHQICILVESYSYMSEDLIHIIKAHGINVWPEMSERSGIINKPVVIETYNSEYKKLVKKKINCSEAIIAFITNKFCKSDECIKLLQHSKQKKKPIIGLIVEEIENYDALKSTVLNGFSYYCEIYKERINPVGYDQYLWVSECFNEMIQELRKILTDEFNLMRYFETDYSIYFFHTIHTNDHLDKINSLCEKFQKVIGDEMCYHENDENNYTYYVDLEPFNISQTLGREYEHDSAYDYFEAKLESVNIFNKNDYLNLIQHFDRLIDFKLNEYIESRYSTQGFDANTGERFPDVKYSRIKLRIKLKRKDYFCFNDSCGELVEYYYEDEDDYVLQLVYKYVREEFRKLKIELSLIHKVLSFLHHLDFEDRGFHDIWKSNVIVFVLFKEFYESEKFEQMMSNFTSCYKSIYIVKFQDFEVDPKYYEAANKENCFGGIYNLHKNIEDDYEGYELQYLFADIRSEIEDIFEIWDDADDNKYIEAPLRDELFVLAIKFDIYIIGPTPESKLIYQLERILKDEEKLKIRVKSDSDHNLEKIEKSKIILFVLTNEYFNTKEFKSEYKLARKEMKTIIFFLLEQIAPNEDLQISFNAFNVIKIYDYAQNGSMWKGESFDRLLFLISSARKEVDFIQTTRVIKVDRLSSIVQSLHLSKVHKDGSLKYINFDFHFDFEENNHILSIDGNKVHIFERNTFNFVKTIILEEKINGICYMKNTKELLMIQNKRIGTMDQNYENIFFGWNFYQRREFKFIQYYEPGKLVFVYDKANNLTFSRCNDDDDCENFIEFEVYMPSIQNGIKDMKIINNHLYFLYEKSVLVYSLDLKPVAKFGNSVLSGANCLLIGSGLLKDFILIASSSSLYVFGLNNYECYDQIPINEASSMKVQSIYMNNNYNLVIIGDNELRVYQVFYTDRDRLKLKLEDSCVCKMDPFKPHLLSNPYILQCGNIACLKCIYKNYNIYISDFKCNFNTCRRNHYLDGDMATMERSNVIEINLNTICQQIVHHARHLPENEMIDCFNNYFDLLENNIDIRFESVMTCFDELEAKALTQVDELEERLIHKAKSSSTSNNDGKHAKLEHELNASFKNWPFKSLKHIKKLKIGDILPFYH